MMTFEEMQTTIQGMLAIQRQLQESQLKNDDQIKELQAGHLAIQRDIQSLIEQSKTTDRLVQQLTGYSITQESNYLDNKLLNSIQLRLNDIESKLSDLS